MNHLSIGDLSKRTGCNIETVRYYERVGLMPKPPRSAGGHRLYRADDLKRLSFIRRSRKLGFTLDEIRALLGMVDGGAVTCAEVKSLTMNHLGTVQRKIKDLRKMESALREMAATCDGGDIPDCPIIHTLFH
jgi:MerR family mercuric resistance operon transcriptional regulator